MKRLTLFFFILIISSASFSQKLSVRTGDKEFDDFNYTKAVEYYEYALKKDANNVHVLRRLAESYHKMNQNDIALNYFELLLQNTDHEDSDWILYGDFLKERGNYSLAKINYQHYLDKHPDDKDVQKQIENVKLFEKQNLLDLVCELTPSPFNSSFSDFSPVYYKENMVFSSGRKSKDYRDDRYDWNGQFFLELFEYDESEQSKKQVVQFANGIGSKYHEGAICFSSDFKTMFFTRSNYFKGKLKRDKKGANNLKIFIAEENNGKWKITDEFPFNSDNYSVGHPSLSSDGRILYFVSDMPGGFGSTDIYRSELKNSEWSQPVNLGSEVNTKGDEMFPYFNSKGSLFFASNGHAGKGGLDLYVVNTKGKTFKAGHLGSPMNSSSDDFSLVMHPDKNIGHFASNREGGQGDDDIYHFKIENENKVNIEVKDSLGENFVIPDHISVLEPENIVLNSEENRYSFSIKGEQSYRIVVEKDNYFSVDTTLYSHILDPELTHLIKIKKQPSGEIRRVNFALKVFVSGDLIAPDILQIIEPKIIDLHPELGTGNYGIDLKSNIKYRVFAKKEGFYALDFGFFCDDAIGNLNHELLMRMISDEDKAKEYLPEDLATVYFDFDRHEVKANAFDNINQVVDILKKHDNLMVTLVARADARGTSEYNNQLAYKRAMATREFFIRGGVDGNRVVILALGDTAPFDKEEGQSMEDWYQMNRCVDFELNTFFDEDTSK